jgi:SAM-dependent methyltransferase
MTLDQLAIKYTTDKSSLFHNYAIKYDRILSNNRNNFKKILEIGIGGDNTNDGGQSLRMWKEYFPQATIFGLDIINKKSQEEDRIQIFQGDQSDLSTLESISNFGPFDLIIDDGSHYYEHQIISFQNLFSSVRPGGFYIIEDVCTSYWNNWGYGTKMTAMDYFKSLIDDVNYYGLRLQSGNPARGDMDRREEWLDTKSNQKFQIYSIQFFNSTICIQKKFD